MALKAVKCKKCGILLGEFLEGSHVFCPWCRQWNQAPDGRQWDGTKKRQPRRSSQEMQRVRKNQTVKKQPTHKSRGFWTGELR